MNEKTLSRWLKVLIIGAGICGIIVYAVVFPAFGQTMVSMGTGMPASRVWSWMFFIWMTGIPCYYVLFLSWKIADLIGQDQAFSTENAQLLRRISWAAGFDGMLFFVGNVVFWLVLDACIEMAFFSMVVVFVGVAVSVASACLSNLVHKAAILQQQSDLTI